MSWSISAKGAQDLTVRQTPDWRGLDDTGASVLDQRQSPAGAARALPEGEHGSARHPRPGQRVRLGAVGAAGVRDRGR